MTVRQLRSDGLPDGVIFDLDGVLTDTAELHYQSWQFVADRLRLPFDRQANEQLRGLSREESLLRVLGPRVGEFSAEQRREIMREKNDEYLRRVAAMTPADLFEGAEGLLRRLREAAVFVAVASSSRNADVVLDRLRIRELLDAVVDGNQAARSKPDPQVFSMAAERLGLRGEQCVAVEDAESGVESALAAGMAVIGIGPGERVGRATLVVDRTVEISLETVRAAFALAGSRTR